VARAARRSALPWYPVFVVDGPDEPEEPEQPERPEPRLSLLPARTPFRRLVALLAGVRNALKSLLGLFGRKRFKAGPYTILVTGATTGVGLALTKLLLETDHRLVLTARRASLRRFARTGIVESERVMLLPLDVSNSHQRAAVVAAVSRRWGGVDVLVNNAGTSVRSVVEQVTEFESITQLETNFFGPMALTRLVLPHMREQRFGRVINVSSVGGMTAMPTMSVYSASKFALKGASEALWYEVRPWGIHVSLVRPGFINSDGFQKVGFSAQGKASLANPEDPYHAHYTNMGELIEGLMTLTFHTPADVAEKIVKTIHQRNPALWVAATWDAYLFDLLRRLLPARVYSWFLYAGLPRIWEWGPPKPRRTKRGDAKK
jgi:short-subunit dehydrogenase